MLSDRGAGFISKRKEARECTAERGSRRSVHDPERVRWDSVKDALYCRFGAMPRRSAIRLKLYSEP